MELLQKFAAVEIRADSRITETDQNYCELHQKAYEAAIAGFQELGFFWADMNTAQKELLGDSGSPFFHDYLSSHGGPSISQCEIDHHIEALHADFIMNLTRYFNFTYHVHVDSSEISYVLLPAKPSESWRGDYLERCEKYNLQMQSLVVRWEDVVEQIILRLDGRSFSEQAFYELYTKCHSAAWNSYEQKPRFERKKDTICFSGYFCRFRGWPYDGWEVSDDMKEILYGLAHYETDRYQAFPVGFSALFSCREVKEPVVEFPTCEMAKQIRLFKTGRVDLKFHSPEYAERFVNKYLGAVY